MVKGVNKNVIEIVDTGNEMFERAILFLRPHARDNSPERVDASARGFLGSLRLRRRWFPAKNFAATLLKYGVSMCLGAMLAVFFLRMY